MLYDEDDVLEPLVGNQHIRCKVDGCRTRASWTTEPAAGGEPLPMCGWHVLYGGSKWGEERRDEIVRVGPAVVAFAEKNRGPQTHVPPLDPRGRFADPVDAERYLKGIKDSTRVAKRLMGRIALMRGVLGGGAG